MGGGWWALIILVWLLLAAGAGLVIGRSIALADQGQRRPDELEPFTDEDGDTEAEAS